MRHLLYFFDTSQTVPLIAVVIFSWLVRKEPGRAVAIGLSLVCAIALVTGTKVAFVGWAIGSAQFTGLSGDVTIATIALWVMFRAVTPVGAARELRWFFAGCAGYLAILVAATRVISRSHTVLEVVLALLVGIALGKASDKDTGPLHPAAPRRMAIVLLSVFLLTYGHLWRSQPLVTVLALKLSGHRLPYIRPHPHPSPWPRPSMRSL